MGLSAFGFSLMAVFVKLANASGIPVLEIVIARALISLILSYAAVKRKGISVWGHKKCLLIARGAVGALALCCVYYSLTRLPLAEATLIQYLHPMFTGLLAFVFLQEILQRETIVCIFLSLIGIVLIAQPTDLFGASTMSDDLGAIGAAVAGAFGSAVTYVLVRKLNETEDASVIIFYFPLIALPIAIMLSGGNLVLPVGIQWGYLLLVGVFTQMGQIGLTKAMQSEGAGKAVAYSYLQVVFAVFFGWLFFSEVPGFWTCLGGGLIVMGALINLMWRC